MNLTKTQKSIIRTLFIETEKSRSALAKDLHLSNAGLTLAIKPLLNEGLVIEAGKIDTGKVGRKELKLKLKNGYGSFLGIDIRKHNLYVDSMDLSGNIIESQRFSSVSELISFLSLPHHRYLAVGLTLRGQAGEEEVQRRYPDLFDALKKLDLPLVIRNNVDCLADIYALYHPNDRNFLLIKYGPGVGSSVYIDGKSLGNLSELGHTYYREKTLEDTISYPAILKQEVDEEEGTPLILENPSLLNSILKPLAFSICNADSLLSLQKIVLSGMLLSLEENKTKLIGELLALHSAFDTRKLTVYQDYQSLNQKKSCLYAFIKTFA